MKFQVRMKRELDVLASKDCRNEEGEKRSIQEEMQQIFKNKRYGNTKSERVKEIAYFVGLASLNFHSYKCSNCEQ